MNPRIRQLFVAASTYLAAISAGATIGHPAVLLQQFKGNNSDFQVDADTSSWIGSIQGIAGIPSILIPTLMQMKGRKFTYFISCGILALGWIIIFLAKDIITIIIGQFFLGLGSSSYVSVAYITLSELVEPKLRGISLLFISVFINVGLLAVHALGRYFCWSYVDAIMLVPILISGGMSLFWQESPAWLAYKSKFEKCKICFTLLRGTNDSAAKELRELMHLKGNDEIEKKISFKEKFKSFWTTLLRRDSYWPCLHTIVILFQMYWGGNIIFYIYSAELLKATTSDQTAISIGLVFIDVIIIGGTILCGILLNYFDAKYILLASGTGATICSIATCIFSFLQFLGFISKDSLFGYCCLLGYITSSATGITNLAYSLPTELIPVKHKSFGGALYVICVSVFHSSVLKSFPYMMDYFGFMGTLVCYNVVLLICTFYIWKYVPETRNKTLQEIEMSYNRNEERNNIDESETLTKQADVIYETTVYKLQ